LQESKPSSKNKPKKSVSVPKLRLKPVTSRLQKMPKLRTKQPMRRKRKLWKWSKKLKRGRKISKECNRKQLRLMKSQNSRKSLRLPRPKLLGKMNNVMPRRLVAELKPKLQLLEPRLRLLLQRHPPQKPLQALEPPNLSVNKNSLRLLNAKKWSMNRL
jgi:hypothetical protein